MAASSTTCRSYARATRGFCAKSYAAAAAVLVAFAATEAAAEPAEKATLRVQALDHAREIPSVWSASRDTPRFEMELLPRTVMAAGTELSLFGLHSERFSLRTGFGGLLELDLETDDPEEVTGPFAFASGRILWRGAYGFQTAFAVKQLAGNCPDCRLEFVFGYRHESEHATASNGGGEVPDASHLPYVGNSLGLELAASQQPANWYLSERVSGAVFLPNASSYDGRVSLDLHARWMIRSPVHPFVSAFAEHLAGGFLDGRQFPDAYRLRLNAGLAIPSALGDVMVFAFAARGHRYGLAALREEESVGAAIRLTIGNPPNSRREGTPEAGER